MAAAPPCGPLSRRGGRDLKRYAAQSPPRRARPAGRGGRRLLCELPGLPRPGVGRVAACGVGVAWWVCGRAVSGLRRSVRGPPGGRGPASPHKSAGVGRAALVWLWAALRGWAALACLRASRSPLIPPHFAGPPVGPAAGWAAPSVSAAAPWFVGFCVPAAASPRPPPWAGAKGRIVPPPTGVRNSAGCGRRWKTGPHGGPGGTVRTKIPRSGRDA